MQTYESDVCVVGGGISAALISQKLSELAPDATVTVLEAGDRFFDLRARSRNRRRWLDYRENAWPGDFIEDQEAEGMISRTMAVGGSALHWGGGVQPFLAGRPGAALPLRIGGGLAPRMGGVRAIHLRGGAAFGSAGRRSAVSRRSAFSALPDAAHAALLQPAATQALGRKRAASAFRARPRPKTPFPMTAGAGVCAATPARCAPPARATRPTSPSGGCWTRTGSPCTTARSSGS